ncbi:MAG TPA: competence/damage-inducible protein A [Verrucomicrobiota bacterium]|nr:competence/damage-inducible protein A [Verrucomicrobiota bacterium]
MIVELINTGSELLLGRILNAHQQWLGRRLADMGRPISRQITVPDTADAIEAALQDALTRADLVITTGGLGPTSDDVTRDRVAAVLGRKLVHQPEIESQIRRFFESRGRTMPERTRVESFVPEGAVVLPNRHGTAPGLVVELNPNPFRSGEGRSWVVLLPGPPREMQPMFDDQVRPWIESRLPLEEAFVSETYRTTGLGESLMEARLDSALQPLLEQGLTVGYCARVGEVDVRFVARGRNAEVQVRAAGAILESVAGEFVFGRGDDSLEGLLVRELTARKMSLALAESCTGGHLANRITNIPGASAVLLGGYVTYANAAKTSALGVPPELLVEHGAVSEVVARAMAEGAQRVTGADYALSVTGIAGPAGGSEEKPVGTVFIGLACPDRTSVSRHLNCFDRETFKFLTAQQAFDQLRRELAKSRI